MAATDQSRYAHRMLRKLLALAAWGTLAFICFVSLSPMHFRPEATLESSAASQRIIAYFLLGLLFGAAYPARLIRSLMFVIFVALALEAMQELTPDRHGRVIDALEKVVGSVSGCVAARAIQVLIDRHST
ncbi:VanZ family protein [Bradyrhizobium guangdongense]